jgi:hypothetical protein
MAEVKYGINLNMDGNGILNTVLHSSSIAPTPAVTGHLWFDSTNLLYRFWNGTSWAFAGSGGDINQFTGILAVTGGGTGRNGYPLGAILYGDGGLVGQILPFTTEGILVVRTGNVPTVLSPIGTSGKMIRSNGTGWVAVDPTGTSLVFAIKKHPISALDNTVSLNDGTYTGLRISTNVEQSANPFQITTSGTFNHQFVILPSGDIWVGGTNLSFGRRTILLGDNTKPEIIAEVSGSYGGGLYFGTRCPVGSGAVIDIRTLGSGFGGSILARGGVASGIHAGNIDISASGTLGGGSLFLSAGGGSIDTRGSGYIQFGVDGTRTLLGGTATTNRSLNLPNNNGTLAVVSNISGIIIIPTGHTSIGTLSLTANTNNIANGSGQIHIVKISPSGAGTYKITGLDFSHDGQVLYIVNNGNKPFRISGLDSGSTSTGQFSLPLPWCVVRPGDVYQFVYHSGSGVFDSTSGVVLSDKWRYVRGMEDWKNDPNYCSELYEEFVGGSAGTTATIGELGWQHTGFGTGSTLVAYAGEEDIIGARVLRINANESARQLSLQSPTTAFFKRGSGNIYEWSTLLRLSELSTGSVEYVFSAGIGQHQTGFLDTPSASASPFMGFEYDRARYGNIWRTVSHSNINGVQISSGTIPVTTGWFKLAMVYNALENTCKYLVNDVLIATHVSGFLDISETFTICEYTIENQIGAAQRDVIVDWFRFGNYRQQGRVR